MASASRSGPSPRPASVGIVVRQLRRTTGAVRHARVQIRLFCALGSRVDVYGELVDARLVSEAGGVPHALLARPLGGYWRRRLFNARALRRLRRDRHELVIGHGDIMVQDVLCLHNCTHLAHELVHGRPAPPGDVMGRLHGELLTRGTFRLLVANSNLMKEDVGRRFGIAPERVGVVHRGHDPAQFRADERDARRPRLREELRVGRDEVLIGLVTSGNFEKRNVALFLRAVSQLPPDLRSRCRCLVVGRDRRAAHYRALAAELGLAERTDFRDAFPDVQDAFHALDVYVLPARLEEFGRSALEAMACGLPVITSDRVGCAELLRGRSLDFVFPSDRLEELVRRLGRLIPDPALRRELGGLNREVALENTESHEARRFEALLSEHGLL